MCCCFNDRRRGNYSYAHAEVRYWQKQENTSFAMSPLQGMALSVSVWVRNISTPSSVPLMHRRINTPRSGPKILEFPSLDTFLTHRLSTSLFPSSSPSLPTHKQYILPSSPTQLLSAEASFTALLSSTTMVYTWGDARHNHLGRALTPVTPSGTPHVVDFLGGIPIRKILTGGWISGALSTSNDLYLWGGRPGEDQRIAALPDLVHHRDGANEEMVKLVDVDGQERDVLDAGIGAGHVIALTDDGRVWAAGRNQNGQLGVVGRGKKDFNERWVEVELCLEEKAMVERIDCGPWSSFLLIRTET